MDYKSLSVDLLNIYRNNNNISQRLASQISTGNRIINSSIDPSGLAMSVSMKGQIRGAQVAVQNCEDTLNLINVADSALENVSNMIMRIRDLAVRMSNEATSNTVSNSNPSIITSSDQRDMFSEMCSLAEEVKREVGGLLLDAPPFIITESSVKYNGKEIFFANYDSGQAAQVGANADSSNSISIKIQSLAGIIDSISLPAVPPPGNWTAADFRNYGLIQIDEMDDDLATVNDVRATLGVQAKTLEQIISDLNQQNISLSDTESTIADTDMTEAVSSLKQNIITRSTAESALMYFNEMRKSNLEYLSVLPINNNGAGVSLDIEKTSK